MPTQSTNISGGPYGIVYSTSGETWTINKGVSVSATVAGVLSYFPGSTLINDGAVNGNTYGVHFNPFSMPGNLDVQNTKSGSIFGTSASSSRISSARRASRTPAISAATRSR